MEKKTIYMTGKKGYMYGLYRLLNGKYPQFYNWRNHNWEKSENDDVFFYGNCVVIDEEKAKEYEKLLREEFISTKLNRVGQ